MLDVLVDVMCTGAETLEWQCKMMFKKIHVCLLTSPAAVTPDKLIFVTNETFGGWSGYLLPHSNFKEYIRPSYGHCELNNFSKKKNHGK